MKKKVSEKQLEKFINGLKKVLKSAGAVNLFKELESELLCFKGKEKINKLEYALEQDDELPASFIFGAGISIPPPFQLQSWSELVKQVSLNYFYCTYPVSSSCTFENFKDYFNEKSFFKNADLYELAQYIENNLKANKKIASDSDVKDRKMYTLVKNGLYNDKDRNFDESFKDSYLFKLGSIIRIRKVNRIITYNYDDCFEYSYNFENNPENKAESIYTDDMLRKKINEADHCYVYHVHGFIPYYTFSDFDLYKYGDEAKNEYEYEKNLSDEELKLILSEDSYSEIAHSSYKWRNTVQVDTLLRYRCIFMGFSATDKNFKRIINLLYWHEEKGDENSRASDVTQGVLSDKNRHYIFLTIDDYIKQIFSESALNGEFTPDPLSETKARFLLQILKDKKNYLAQVKLTPLWTTPEDICQIVDEYYNYLSKESEKQHNKSRAA